jgi:diguanylate cyclase (GGDEF)-like protein
MISDQGELARLRDQLTSKASQIEALCDSVADLTSNLKLGELLGDLVAYVAAAIPAASAALVALARAGDPVLVITASYGLDLSEARRSAWYKNLSRTYVRLEGPVTLSTPAENGSPPCDPTEEIATDLLPGGCRTAYVTPLLTAGKKAGFLAVFSPDPCGFSDEDRQLLGGFAMVAASAVRHTQMRREIEDLNVTDRLTGVLNRRGFMDLLGRELRRARRSGRPLAVVKIELDDLKAINERHGHAVGDQLLRGIGRSLQHELRAVDLIGRFGAGSFFVTLVETPAARAARVADRLKRVLTEAAYETRRGEMRIGISMGMASSENGLADVNTLLGDADDALRMTRPFSRR